MRDHLLRRGTYMAGLLLLAAAAISCGDDQGVAATDGTILVGARTTGSDFDVNGYLVSVNNSQGEEIGHQDTIWVSALDPGDYVVGLGDMAGNCTVPQETNPQTATVNAGDTVEVLFDITCEPLNPDDGGGGNLLRMRR